MMSSVLKKVNLGYLEEKFQQEKITPDLVCKLSVQELESLGLTSRRDMMALRIECATFGGEAPRWATRLFCLGRICFPGLILIVIKSHYGSFDCDRR